MSGLHHVGLSVADLDQASAWYARAFGYEEQFRAEIPTMRVGMGVLADGTRLELLERFGSQPGAQRLQPDEALLTQGWAHIAFDIADLDATYAALIETGARPVWPPRQSPEPGVRMAFVHDPDGNLIELVSRNGGG